MTTQEAPGIDNGEIREYRQAAEEQKKIEQMKLK